MFWSARSSGEVTKATRPDTATRPLATLLLECRPHYDYCGYLSDSSIIEVLQQLRSFVRNE